MNKDKLEELLADLHDGAHGDRHEAIIPNDERVIMEAYKMGFNFGHRVGWDGGKMWAVRSEPTTGAGLVKEVDDCIALATERQDSQKGLWVCAGIQYDEHCNSCAETNPHKHDDFCDRPCPYRRSSPNSCVPWEINPRERKEHLIAEELSWHKS